MSFFKNKINVCSDKGIFHYLNGKFQKNNLFPAHLLFNDIKEKNNKIFAASSSGVWLLDNKNKKAINLLENTSYENMECFSIEMDDFNHIWVGTSKGLLRINYMNQDVEVYLDDVEFNKRSSLFNKGKLYFGSTSGLYSFNPTDFLLNEHILDLQKDTLFSNMEFLGIGSLIIFLAIIIYVGFKKYLVEKMPNLPIQPILVEGEPLFDMDNIELFILKNIDNITAESLRESSGMSKHTFYKNFSQKYDITVKKLIDTIRQDHQKWKKK